MMINLRNLILIITTATIFFSCASQKAMYDKAKEINTEGAYKEYLIKYPNGDFAENAKFEIARIKFTEAKKNNTEDSYKNFISEFGFSEFADSAKKELARIKFTEAKKNNNEDSYKNFINEFEFSEFADSAKQELTKIKLENAKLTIANLKEINKTRIFIPGFSSSAAVLANVAKGIPGPFIVPSDPTIFDYIDVLPKSTISSLKEINEASIFYRIDETQNNLDNSIVFPVSIVRIHSRIISSLEKAKIKMKNSGSVNYLILLDIINYNISIGSKGLSQKVNSINFDCRISILDMRKYDICYDQIIQINRRKFEDGWGYNSMEAFNSAISEVFDDFLLKISELN